MEISAGLLIIFGNKVLLAKPSKGTKNMWGIPKGKVEDGEQLIEAAIRETKEEIGIDIPLNKIIKDAYTISYRNKKTRKQYKKVIYYVCEVSELSELGLETEKIPKGQLQPREISKARFFTVEEAEDKIFWRQKEILNFIKEVK